MGKRKKDYFWRTIATGTEKKLQCKIPRGDNCQRGFLLSFCQRCRSLVSDSPIICARVLKFLSNQAHIEGESRDFFSWLCKYETVCGLVSLFFAETQTLPGRKNLFRRRIFLSNWPRGGHDDDEGLCSLPLFYLFF